jgi:hypothetical protein
MFFVAGYPGHLSDNAIWCKKADLHHDGGEM